MMNLLGIYKDSLITIVDPETSRRETFVTNVVYLYSKAYRETVVYLHPGPKTTFHRGIGRHGNSLLCHGIIDPWVGGNRHILDISNTEHRQIVISLVGRRPSLSFTLYD